MAMKLNCLVCCKNYAAKGKHILLTALGHCSTVNELDTKGLHP